jgi:hypothetical protein
MTVSGIWLAAGLIYVAIRTRGFRAAPVIIDFTESQKIRCLTGGLPRRRLA